jgi:hypothetical protein
MSREYIVTFEYMQSHEISRSHGLAWWLYAPYETSRFLPANLLRSWLNVFHPSLASVVSVEKKQCWDSLHSLLATLTLKAQQSGFDTHNTEHWISDSTPNTAEGKGGRRCMVSV